MAPKVLIADDSKFSLKVIREAVLSGGYEISECVGDGALALESYRKNIPDLVILDITMPNMSGKECLSEIMKLNANAKVIMISALTNPELESECIAIGAKAFLSKSMSESPEGFRNAILSTIGKLKL